MTRLFFVAGESSGDIHGANLLRALRAARPGWEFEGLGGARMAAAGMALRHDLAGKAIMGFAEVVRSLSFIRRLFNETRARLAETRPDALVLVDYPGFNLRLAGEAKKLGIPVVYYISPQVWAWKKRRIHTIARVVDKMLVILPFEEEYYRRAGVPCVYVGNPLLDHVEGAALQTEPAAPEAPVVGLLPGSREMEIRRIAPVMLETARRLRAEMPGTVFEAPCVNDERAAQLRALAGDLPLTVRVGGMAEVLSRARCCMVASGTATLETALFGVPLVIVYRMNPLTYQLARRLVKVEHIGIVNLLAGRRVAPEFVQQEASPERLLPAMKELLADSPARRAMLDGFREVRELLGGPGASARAAAEIVQLVEERKHG
ncbi:MAG TPA: lipid-A-disaccharide synthase [Candidatus Hydrogenedentes bacterium]|nr:lipid-A-disaccharide synthase [Candidatus Hydrogenedentota bacterium]